MGALPAPLRDDIPTLPFFPVSCSLVGAGRDRHAKADARSCCACYPARGATKVPSLGEGADPRTVRNALGPTRSAKSGPRRGGELADPLDSRGPGVWQAPCSERSAEGGFRGKWDRTPDRRRIL
jgi:hypothetical protein